MAEAELPVAAGSWLWRGFPPGIDALPLAEVAAQGWRTEDLVTPVATLDRGALAHNQARLDAWLAEVGARFAPHCKTTMSPELMRLQLDAGAWALTAANPWQAAVMVAAGAPRVLIANEVGSPGSLAELLPRAEIWVFADSPEAVGVVAAAGRRAGVTVPVVLDIGFAGGRTGVRTEAAALAVAEAAGAEGARLAGYGLFEGILAGGRAADDLARVHAALTGAARIVERVHARHEFPEPVVTAGGSLLPDLVAEVFGPLAAGLGGRLVLRPGCYLVHDHGSYDAAYRQTPWLDLRAALRIHSTVLSVPEPGLALLDAGKRDLSLDGRTAPVLGIVREHAAVAHPPLAVARSNDQHSYLEWDPSAWDGLKAGDRLSLGVSHPCVTFQLWRALPVLDGDAVVGAVRTFF